MSLCADNCENVNKCWDEIVWVFSEINFETLCLSLP